MKENIKHEAEDNLEFLKSLDLPPNVSLYYFPYGGALALAKDSSGNVIALTYIPK